MRKTLTAALLGLTAAVAGPMAGAQATTDSTQWRGHYTLYTDCVQAGNNILMTSPKAQTYECREFPLGGFDLYVTY
ncbi:hypothetical protein [Kribbella sp.]|uniref:hypothetical protein n=1 Tax=Kribbella sp. TaxID=1871183 RepID=UPI002D316AD2|nr:hypothetical protein [Kribbella sp.]HZX07072.1 hypothetical protein [Kribbella sp.]